jgi:4-amino-4-deoxy-L-arabinose transferase-like glycosyltransferase
MTKARVVLVASAIVYLTLSLDHLSVFPAIEEDEPWIAAAAYKLAKDGVYGSDLFAGYYGVDRHNYQHMPLYPLMQAVVFKASGVGVFQMRLLPVFSGLGLLVVVFLVGKQLGDERVGALAVVLMLGLRISAGDDATGILFLDRVRVNRYDIAVPVFGLLALCAFFRAERRPAPGWYLLTGILTGLSSLSHLFGAFWLPLFLGLLLYGWHGTVHRAHTASLVILGFLLTWLPWLAYIASGWEDYLGQMRFVASRFEVFDPSFYISNALYGGGPISLDWMLKVLREQPWNRPGTWSVLVGIPVAFGAMAWSGAPERDRHRAARMLGVAALLQLLMFLVLLKVKTVNYMIGLWPLGALLLAWLGIRLWDSRSALMRVGILVLLALILGEGFTRVAHARTAARSISPYEWFASEIARCIPAGSLVLGLQHYWLGLRQFSYRTWLMPINYAHPLYHHAPLPIEDVLDLVNPDIILIDRHMARFFEAASAPDHPLHAMQTGFESFLARGRTEPICVIHNKTYGTMIVYRVQPSVRHP